MTEVPHTCCTLREGYYWICMDCHPGKIAPAYALEALCDTHLKLQMENTPWSFNAVPATEPDASISEPPRGSGTGTFASTVTDTVIRLSHSFMRLLRKYYPILFRSLRRTSWTVYRKHALVPEQCPTCGAKPYDMKALKLSEMLKAHYSGWQIEFQWYPFWPLHRWTTHCMDCIMLAEMKAPSLLSKIPKSDWTGGTIRVPFGGKP